MSEVLVALADLGPGVALEEALNRAGLAARWDGGAAGGPRPGDAPAAVVLDADHLGPRLGEVVEAWRAQPSVPGVVALGRSAVAQAATPSAHVELVSAEAPVSSLVDALRDAFRLRLSASLRWPLLRAAVGLAPAPDGPAARAEAIVAARRVELDIPRAALRWYAHHYVTPTARLGELRDDRVLTVPELDATARLDGTTTVLAFLKHGRLDPHVAARLMWALACAGAVELGAEVRDTATPARHALAELRYHLRARAARLHRSTYYDVLEVTPAAEREDLDEAYRRIAARFGPDVAGRHDLGELGALVEPMWALVEKARTVLADHAARGRYHDFLKVRLPTLRTTWALELGVARAAGEAFARGQAALVAGDLHRAMGELAAACRQHPGHPEYEASLAWTRYRVQVAAGRDNDATAAAERRVLEEVLAGCRVWPRALVALAMLCVAGDDRATARWHLDAALAVEPDLAAALQLRQRLEAGR